MELREEELLSKIEYFETADEKAKERNLKADQVLTKRDESNDFGMRMNRILLLTAAFGVAHQAFHSDLIAGCTTM